MNKHIIKAIQKGLCVKRNSFIPGWTITLPNSGTYHALTDKDMIAYVKGY